MIEFALVVFITIVITSWFQYTYTCVYGNHNFQRVSGGRFSCAKCGITKVAVRK